MQRVENDEQKYRLPATVISRACGVQLGSIVFALTTLVCAGCATPDDGSAPREEKVYRTGSNLPVRDRDAKTNSTVVEGDAVRRSVAPGPVTPGLGRN